MCATTITMCNCYGRGAGMEAGKRTGLGRGSSEPSPAPSAALLVSCTLLIPATGEQTRLRLLRFTNAPPELLPLCGSCGEYDSPSSIDVSLFLSTQLSLQRPNSAQSTSTSPPPPLHC